MGQGESLCRRGSSAALGAGAVAMEAGPQADAGREPAVRISSSRNFASWLAERRASLAFTTYQAGKLFLIGTKADGQLSIFERSFDRCMGLAGDGQTLWMSSRYQFWRLENALDAGEHGGHDRVYLPQASYITGDIDAHDIGLDAKGRPIFVNTLFSCLARPSETHSFAPVWKPPFISRLAAEDRCHLNGLAMRDGAPAYVTLVAQSDLADGWRDRRRDGGALLDVGSGEAVATGLSMPHSPRWRDGRVWLLNSGLGEFGFINPNDGRFDVVAFCPGYARGLAFLDGFAIIGLSRPRDGAVTFEGLPLTERLTQAGAEPRCGLLVIDLERGDVVEWLRIEGVVQELYDVVALPGVRRPSAIGFKSDQIRRTITIGHSSPLGGTESMPFSRT
jgi:uncharacterized protein (TIGR03032 family)